MKSSQDILSEVKKIFADKWGKTEGRTIPETEDIQLGNEAVMLEGTVLYADLNDSTGLVNNYKSHFAAEVYKAYLVSACYIIRNNSGEITAFDGDRVMAVFIGDYKNSSAAKAALQINHIVREINVAMKAQYPSTAYQLRQYIGIDTGSLFIARTGIRNANDLVWIGSAANYAAKLCSLGDASYATIITEAVFDKLSDSVKYGGNPRRCMWDKAMWQEKGIVVYKSNWWWSF